MITGRKTLITGLVILALAMLPLTAQAVSYTWTGSSSIAWNNSGNWTGGTFPGNGTSYTDQATINVNLPTNTPVSLGTTVLLGGATTALTIGTSAGATALDITGTGLLGMQGNISLRKAMTIEGTLRNDAASSATTYTISGTGGSIGLVGGTISSLNGGKWTFSDAVTGFGTISSQFTGSVTASGGTLHITNPLESIAAGSLHSNSGAILSLEGITVSGGALASTGETDLNGVTLNGVTNVSGNVQLKGDSTLNTGGITNLLFNGHKLDVTGTVTNYGSIHVDAGTLNNAATTGTTTVSNSNFLYLTGGSITNTGGSNFVFGTNISGYGSVSGITSETYGIIANGGTSLTPRTLNFDAGAGINLGTHTGSGVTMSSAAFTTLDLKGTYNYINPGIIAPGAGTVALNGATLNTYDPTGGTGGTPTTWNLSLNPGAINVVNNSTLIGNFTSSANLTINPGKTLNASGASFTNTGTVNNNGGTATWGGTFTNNGAYISDPSTQTFTDLTVATSGYLTGATVADVFNIKGNFINNSTQNTSWNTSAATLAFLTNGTTTTHTFRIGGGGYGRILGGTDEQLA